MIVRLKRLMDVIPARSGFLVKSTSCRVSKPPVVAEGFLAWFLIDLTPDFRQIGQVL